MLNYKNLAQKIRKQYQHQNVTIQLDELTNGEKHIEVEAKEYSNLYAETGYL